MDQLHIPVLHVVQEVTIDTIMTTMIVVRRVVVVHPVAAAVVVAATKFVSTIN